MRKIYLSAAYSRKEEVESLAVQIRALGHETTSRWHHGAPERCETRNEQRACAMTDMADVLRCNLFVYLSGDGVEHGGGMRHCEFGLAYAYEKACWMIGRPEHIGHNLPGVFHLADTDALLNTLECLV